MTLEPGWKTAFQRFLSYIIIQLIRRVRAAFAGTPFGNTREENQP